MNPSRYNVNAIYDGFCFTVKLSTKHDRVFLLPGDSELSHPGTQRAGIDAKEECRSAFSFDAPHGFHEHLKDVIPFQIDESFDWPY